MLKTSSNSLFLLSPHLMNKVYFSIRYMFLISTVGTITKTIIIINYVEYSNALSVQNTQKLQ